MLANYLRLALRTFRKQPGYTLINIIGLALGLACCLLIGLYVHQEFQYDRHHDHIDRIYRANVTFITADERRQVVSTPSILAPYLRREVAGVETAARLYPRSNRIVAYEERRFEENGFFYADSTIVDVFTIPFLTGDPATALTRPNTIVLTERAAHRYFGDVNPLGQTLTVNNTADFEVTGVVATPPATSHLAYDFLASWTTIAGWSEASDEQLRAANFLTYVLARPGTDTATLEARLSDLVDRYLRQAPSADVRIVPALQPLAEVHLYTPFDDETGTQGSIATVWGVLAIGALILLIACINYMNLATARAAQRAREVGMRKALGARRTELMGQFFGESALLVGVAALGALALAALVLPGFKQLAGTALEPAQLTAPWVLALLGALWAAVSLAAGSYPALYLSAFQPVVVLKGVPRTSGGAAFLRRGLVVAQFAISVFLIAGTLTVYQQLDFVQTTDLGFDQEHIVVLPLNDGTLRAQAEALQAQLEQQASIVRTTAASAVPGDVRAGYRLSRQETPDQADLMIGLYADEAFPETLGLTFVAGRSFSTTRTPDEAQEAGYEFILNERAVQRLGFASPEDALSRRVVSHGRQGAIVGVVSDFHFASLHDDIRPLFLFNVDEGFNHLLVKTAGADLAATMASLRETWAAVAPHRPFDARFLDASFDALYRQEQRIGQLLGVFSGLAIFIACLGLLGLAAFTAEQRTREIGVRKTLGATVPGLMALLARDFAALVVIGLVISVPAAYLALNRWLSDFAYRIELGALPFVAAGGLALAIALATVSYQAFRAARVNPVEALRYE